MSGSDDRSQPVDPELLLGQGTPSVPSRGCGPGQGRPSQHDYHHPAAGWGAAQSVGRVFLRQRELREAPRIILRMNHEDGGFDCPGCAARYLPELNVLCPIGGYSPSSRQPVMKHLAIEVTPSAAAGSPAATKRVRAERR